MAPGQVIGSMFCAVCDAELPADSAALCPSCLQTLGLVHGQSDEVNATLQSVPTDQGKGSRNGVAHLGNYKILEEVGRGEFATVYRAHDCRLDKLVALKIPAARFVRDQQYVEAFMRETLVTAGLHHRNIVHAHAVGRHQGVYYLAMEYVDGEELRGTMRSNPVADEDTAAIAAQIREALRFARDNGVQVRKLRPASVLVAKGGRVKLAASAWRDCHVQPR